MGVPELVNNLPESIFTWHTLLPFPDFLSEKADGRSTEWPDNGSTTEKRADGFSERLS
jgi:hypothetical protein